MYGAVGWGSSRGAKGPEARPAYSSGDRRWCVVPARSHPVLWIDRAAVVSAPAQVDVRNAGDVLACLLSVIREGPATLVVDLTATAFCDAAGLSSLVQAFRRADASGTEMRLAVSGPAVRRILEVTGIDQLIGTYPSVPESLIGGLDPPGAQPSSKTSGLGGSPLTLVTIAAARSRSLTLRFCDASRSRSNARVCVHRSWAMITPMA
jgi:anti-sigma B factor antagonist